MFEKFDVKDFQCDPFRLFSERWALLVGGEGSDANPMTIGWGALGTLWRAPMVTVYVRPDRYTYGLMEEREYFTVCFFPPEQKKMLSFMGANSGRDMDKAARCGLKPVTLDCGAVCYEEAELVLVCKTAYAAALEPERKSGELSDRIYGEGVPWHKMYIGEVTEALRPVR